MNIVDNIIYEDVLNDFEEEIKTVEKTKKNKLISVIGSILITALIAASIITVSILILTSKNTTTDLKCILLILIIIISIPVFYGIISVIINDTIYDYKNTIEFLKNGGRLLEEKLTTRQKALKCFTDEYCYYNDSKSIKKYFDKLDFLEKCKIIKFIYETNRKTAVIVYAEDGEVKQKNITCDIKYFLDCDKTEFVITNNGFYLKTKYIQNMEQTLDLTDTI